MTNAGAGKRRPGSRKKPKKKNQQGESSAGAGNNNNNPDVPFLPDNIILDIVSRLPTEDVSRFQCVSKSAMRLICSNRIFINSRSLNIRSSSAPLLLVIDCHDCHQPFLLHKCWDSQHTNAKLVKRIRRYRDYIIQSSHDGLIVSIHKKDPGSFIIFNPIRATDFVKINIASEPQGEIYGVFYQPSKNQYSTLWAFFTGQGSNNVAYKMLDLASPNLRDITNPWSHYKKVWSILPVLVGEYLYWAVEVPDDNGESTYIMEFDTIREVFELIPRPPRNTLTRYEKINLLQSNGVLLFVQVNSTLRSNAIIDIWTLEDRENKIWTGFGTKVITENLFHIFWPETHAFWNGELVLSCRFGLFVCNIELGTTRKFGRDDYCSQNYSPHVTSLASLENCHSHISVRVTTTKTNHAIIL